MFKYFITLHRKKWRIPYAISNFMVPNNFYLIMLANTNKQSNSLMFPCAVKLLIKQYVVLRNYQPWCVSEVIIYKFSKREIIDHFKNNKDFRSFSFRKIFACSADKALLSTTSCITGNFVYFWEVSYRIMSPPIQRLLGNGSRWVWVLLHAQWEEEKCHFFSRKTSRTD